MDRAVVDAVRNCRESHRFNRALVAWTGFRHASISYVAANRHSGVTYWNWRRLVVYAMDGILSFSVRPLRLVGPGRRGHQRPELRLPDWSSPSLRIVRPELAGADFGYASIIGMVSLIGGFQLLGIWLLGEYVGRIYEQVKGRPSYVVREPRTIDALRGNVRFDHAESDPAATHRVPSRTTAKETA